MAAQRQEREPADGSTIRAGGLDVGYIDRGSGVPLVLIHGGEGDRTAYATLRAHLGAGIRAISYDQRDSGITVNPPVPYTLGDLGDDVADLLDALGLRSAHLLGTSFGGAVAQHAALRHPERVESLVLIATTPSFALGADAINKLLNLSYGDMRDAVDDYFLTPEGRARIGTRAAQTLMTRDPEQRARRHAAAREHEIRDRLGEITAPTLIVHGTEDRLAPYPGAVMMEQRMPNAGLRSIEGGRHAVGMEFADEIALWVREFLGVTAE
ncbi:alpha/beta fold hydrolase [Actinomadura madurae]|uniref:alpha/beta fold hydrolase n=1 Tax=Actinomadura madurae TaxID=1993 RepID=UPI002025E709|nr:alpha/beta hydrolase [Actinomadura madurae]MCP9955647.1 alpha/beta hydrolase [Actinomadura madurae]MCP9972382.1 alpha/beta hydrolase [Actinomadura madurae]MCP9984894.1 alpha/beta hydrolase [Actinomadura madurae]MCQ0003557.1 alpha/beta hydrolase [Actinomadura madurae]MCQ0021082.1 alpha/beta hydrolase [Actinomadura madurae]